MERCFKLMPDMDIEGRKVGFGHPVFIIAEIGVNHNGNLDIAKQMVERAAECGVDCVKFQTFSADEFIADKDMVYEYEAAGKKISENMFDMFKRLEMPSSWHKELFAYSRKCGLVPLTSVADPKSVDLVCNLGISAFKLSSEDLINLPLVEYVANKRMPLILSTGMADEDEIEDVLKILKECESAQAAFLHCVSLYPTPAREANLLRMAALRKKVNGPVGYSDHTIGTVAAIGATALGACIIEKHFTLDRNMRGPDHAFSSDVNEMKNIVSGIRKAEEMIGKADLKFSPSEIEMRKQFRRSIVAARDLPKGHAIERKDLWLKRPGIGLKAKDIPFLLGKTLTIAVKKDEPITYEKIA